MSASSGPARLLLIAVLAAPLLTVGPPTARAATAQEGDFDAGFAQGGRARANFVSDGPDEARAVALTPGGRIVVAGWDYDAVKGGYGMGVVRYLADGSLDESFNHGGLKSVDFGDAGGDDQAYAVAVQPDSKILLAGTTLTDHFEMSVARLNTDGTLDQTFSGDGLRHLLGGAIYGMALQPDGRIVLAGYTGADYPSITDFAVIRLKPNGSLDKTFGGDGVVTTPIQTNSDQAEAVVVQSDGKIVVAGWSAVGVDLSAAIVRYRPGGALDSDFGSGGKVTLNLATDTDEELTSIALLRDGRIAVGGVTRDGSGIPTGLLARYTATGQPDQTFGAAHTGWFTTAAVGVIHGLARQRDGDLVAAGETADKMVVARFRPGGGLDPDFAGDGDEQVPFGAAGYDYAYAVALQRDGRIVLAGRTYVGTATIGGSDYDFATVRLIGDATRPTGQRVSGLHVFSRSRILHPRWRADDDNTGVRSYDVRVRSARSGRSSYGGWSLLRKQTAKRSTTFAARPGRTYCFAVRARDWAGNVGAWSSPRCTAVPIDDRATAASGSWTAAGGRGDYLRTLRLSAHKGDTLAARVAFRRLALLVRTCAGCGRVRVLLDGRSLGTVDLDAGRTRHRVVKVVLTGTPLHTGTLRLRVAGGGEVAVDGIAVSLA